MIEDIIKKDNDRVFDLISKAKIQRRFGFEVLKPLAAEITELIKSETLRFKQDGNLCKTHESLVESVGKNHGVDVEISVEYDYFGRDIFAYVIICRPPTIYHTYDKLRIYANSLDQCHIEKCDIPEINSVDEYRQLEQLESELRKRYHEVRDKRELLDKFS